MVAGILLLIVFADTLMTGYLMHTVRVYRRRTEDLIAHMQGFEGRMDLLELSHE